MKELNLIQTRIVCQKSRRNEFGKYNYYSLGDVLKALKPLLLETKTTLVTTQDVFMVGDRYYLKSTSTIKNDKGEVEEATAIVGIDESKKGMDLAQLLGSCGSYAAKMSIAYLVGLESESNDSDVQRYIEEATPIDDAISLINACDSMDAIAATWKKFKKFQSEPKFVSAKNNKKKELSDGK